MACLVASTILILGSPAFRHAASLPPECALVVAFGTLAGMGLAAACGQRALLDRVANRSTAGAGVLTRTLVCSALLVWFGGPVAEHLIGESLAFVLLALALLGIGGVLIICEPDDSPRSRRLWLFAVLACVSAIIVMLGPAPLHAIRLAHGP
jgi:hypothetical protein